MTYVEDYCHTKTSGTRTNMYTNCWADDSTTDSGFYNDLEYKLSGYLGAKATSKNIFRIENTINDYVTDSCRCKYDTSDFYSNAGTCESEFDYTTGALKINYGSGYADGANFRVEFGSGGNVSVKTKEMIEKETKLFEMKQKVRSGLVIHIKTRAADISNVPENEQIAIDTLREMITEAEFRKYLRYGFVLVEGQSGDVFQVFRNDWHTKVWRGGRLIEEICVRISNNMNVPPTDNVIAFKTMIETNEDDFRKIGNVYKQKAA